MTRGIQREIIKYSCHQSSSKQGNRELGIAFASRSASGRKEMRVAGLSESGGDCIYPKSAYSCVITSLSHTHALISRGTPALFIPGFQRAQWHKKAGVGAGRDSHNGTVIMTLERPKKKPELLISLYVCVRARRAAQG